MPLSVIPARKLSCSSELAAALDWMGDGFGGIDGDGSFLMGAWMTAYDFFDALRRVAARDNPSSSARKVHA